jgi:hypothetical protein
MSVDRLEPRIIERAARPLPTVGHRTAARIDGAVDFVATGVGVAMLATHYACGLARRVTDRVRHA